jgi:hypothetical protein
MKNILLVVILIALLSIPIDIVTAKNGAGFAAVHEENYFGFPLCLPGMPADGTCLLYGPAQTVAEMKEAGIPYPPRDLPAAQPPSEMNVMPVNIAKINLPDEQPAPIYASFEDAVAGVNPTRYIEPGSMRYVSYVNHRDHSGKPYLQLSTGGWMRAAPIAYTNFQGLAFYENPRNDFGWIVSFDPLQSYLEPSFDAPTTDQTYAREDVIQVYNAIEEDDITWYQIGPDEWMHSLAAAVVSVNATPPEGVGKNRWIEVNLFTQTMSIYEEGELLFATVLATGRDPFFTKPGVFEIDEMQAVGHMQGSFTADRSDFYYLEDVPWVMYYDEARAFHSTYWPFGFGFPQSHGCINLSPGDANWLFQWAELGDAVWVHDPSGLTPTDAAAYGPGAP